MEITQLIISALFISISGISKAICDVSAINGSEDKLSSLDIFWWRKSISSNNKYKNRDPKQGEAFLGSTNIWVWLTDAWHLFDFIRDLSLSASMVLCPMIWYVYPCIYALRQVVFELVYRWLRKPFKK